MVCSYHVTQIASHQGTSVANSAGGFPIGRVVGNIISSQGQSTRSSPGGGVGITTPHCYKTLQRYKENKQYFHKRITFSIEKCYKNYLAKINDNVAHVHS